MGDTFTFFVLSGLGPPMALGSSVSIKKLPFFDSWPPTSTRARYRVNPRLQEVGALVPGSENPSCWANANIWTIAPTWMDGLNGVVSLLNICFLLILSKTELRTYCKPGYSSKRFGPLESFAGNTRESTGAGAVRGEAWARVEANNPARSRMDGLNFIPK